MDEIDPKEIDRRFKVGGCKVTDAITAEVASFHVEASEADLAEVALHEDAMLRRCEDPREQQRRLATAWLSVKSRRKSSSQPRQKRS